MSGQILGDGLSHPRLADESRIHAVGHGVVAVAGEGHLPEVAHHHTHHPGAYLNNLLWRIPLQQFSNLICES